MHESKALLAVIEVRCTVPFTTGVQRVGTFDE